MIFFLITINIENIFYRNNMLFIASFLLQDKREDFVNRCHTYH